MQFVDMFSYTTAGERSGKRLQVHENTQSLNLDAAYTYDTEGKMASVSYPSGGNTYTYSFDSLDRPITLTDQNSNQVVSNVQYNAANQFLSMNYFGGSETRQYNSLGQVTSIVASGSTSLNRTYTYPAGTNNGKISSMTDNISGETVTYQYDSLNRLISAAGSGWGENYGYDSFGNLLSKTPTAGSPPTLSIAVNTANNQVVGYPYAANGNLQAAPSLGTSASLTYDADNRIVAAPGVQYGYDSQNKRVWVATVNSNGQLTGQTAYFYGVDGSMLAAYALTLGSSLTATEAYTAVYFRGKRVGVAPSGTTYSTFIQDRQDSQGSYYPYGEDKGTPLSNDQFKYATYWRDSATSLDYANRRYYVNNFGRFMTPDPYRATATSPSDPDNPQSWNRYAYVLGDPINFSDPSGLDVCDDTPDLGDDDGGGGTGAGGCEGTGGGGGGGDTGGGDPVLCGQGYAFNPGSGTCEPAQPCGPGFALNQDSGECEPVTGLPPGVAVPVPGPGAGNPFAPPSIGTPIPSSQCSFYLDGTPGGLVLYSLCQLFPDAPLSQRMRGCLRVFYVSGKGYISILWPWDTGSYNFPGIGAHALCVVDLITSGGSQSITLAPPTSSKGSVTLDPREGTGFQVTLQ